MILAGDVGGTKSNLGLFDVEQGDAQRGTLVRVAHMRYPSREHAGLEEIIRDFLSITRAQVSAAEYSLA